MTESYERPAARKLCDADRCIETAALSRRAAADSIRHVTLLGDLEAFYQEHRPCGELESEVTDGEPGWVVMACTCGAQIARRISDDSS